jgi:hypothetical protein
VIGFACTENCHGRMVQEFDELALHTQLKCLEALFDVPRLQAKRKLNDVAYVLRACVCVVLLCVLCVGGELHWLYSMYRLGACWGGFNSVLLTCASAL